MSAVQQVSKLMHKLNDADINADLVSAGLTSPRLIKAATNQALEDAVGSENVAAVNSAFGREQA